MEQPVRAMCSVDNTTPAEIPCVRWMWPLDCGVKAPLDGVSAAPAGSQTVERTGEGESVYARSAVDGHPLFSARRSQITARSSTARVAYGNALDATRKIVADLQAKTSGLEDGRADARAELTQAQSRVPAPNVFGENTSLGHAYRQWAECTSSGGRSSSPVHNFGKWNVRRHEHSHAKSHGVVSLERGETKFREAAPGSIDVHS